MKLKFQNLKKIIKEELDKVLLEYKDSDLDEFQDKVEYFLEEDYLAYISESGDRKFTVNYDVGFSEGKGVEVELSYDQANSDEVLVILKDPNVGWKRLTFNINNPHEAAEKIFEMVRKLSKTGKF